MRQPQAANASALRIVVNSAPVPDASTRLRGDRGLLEAAVPAAVSRRRPFHHERGRAAPFAARREPLDQPGDDQQHRRGDADAGVARQHADHHGAERHRHDGEHQRRLAAVRVAEPADDDAAERAHQEPHAEHGERRQQRRASGSRPERSCGRSCRRRRHRRRNRTIRARCRSPRQPRPCASRAGPEPDPRPGTVPGCINVPAIVPPESVRRTLARTGRESLQRRQLGGAKHAQVDALHQHRRALSRRDRR